MVGISNKFLVAINTIFRGNECGAKLENNVKKEEQISDGARERDEDAEDQIGLHASLIAGDREIEIERVEEQSGDARVEERVVPLCDEFGPRVEDLVPPWNLLTEGE